MSNLKVRQTKTVELTRNDKGRGSAAIGALVKDYREAAGLSRTHLAGYAGIHESFLSRIEKGERGMSIETLAELYGLLGSELVCAVLGQLLEEKYPEPERWEEESDDED